MEGIRYLDPATVAVGKGLFSQAVDIDLSTKRRLILISGQVAWDERGEVIGPGDLRAQFAQVYRNLQRVMAAAGGSMKDIVSLRTYLTDPSLLTQFVAARNEMYGRLFPSGRYPTNTLLVISALAEPGLLLEVEAIAAL